MRKIFLFLAFAISALELQATNYYVSAQGNDANNGTSEQTAFATLGAAIRAANRAGDNVYIAAGRYIVGESEIMGEQSPYKLVYDFTTGGVYGKPISFIGVTDADGKRPVFDFSNVNPSGYRVTAFHVAASYLVFRNFEIVGVRVNIASGNTQSENVRVDRAAYCTFDNLAMHDGMGIGMYIHRNASHNLVLNCDAYNNYDSVGNGGRGGNNDGFGCHVSNSEAKGNTFIGCRAWNNADDGYDLINCAAPVTLAYCYAAYSGYDADNKMRGDGNGFKCGGWGMSKTEAVSPPSEGFPKHVARYNMAYNNKTNGVYANHNLAGIEFVGNTSVNSKMYHNFNFLNRKGPDTADCVDVAGYGHVVTGNLSYKANKASVANIDAVSGNNIVSGNSFRWSGSEWTDEVFTDADFESTTYSHMKDARNADGTLSESTKRFYRLKSLAYGVDFSGYEAAIDSAKVVVGAEVGLVNRAVSQSTTWTFERLGTTTIERFVNHDDLVLRGTSGSHAITANNGTLTFAANGVNIENYLAANKDANDDADHAYFDRCLAFNTAVAGTCVVVFKASANIPDRYFEIFFKADGEQVVAKKVPVSKSETEVTLVADKPGAFFIASTLACSVVRVGFMTAVDTGIEVPTRRLDVQSDAVYNLSGQRVGASYHGLVVKNGKKYVQL